MGKMYSGSKSKTFKRAPLRSKTSLPKTKTIQNVVKKQIQSSAEKKEFYTTNTLQNVTTTGTVINLNTIAEGDEFNNRNGRIIKSTYIDIQYSLYNNTLDSSADGSKVALVWDKTPNGTAAAWTDIFLTTASSNPSLIFKNTPNNAERFHIAWMDELPQVVNSMQTGTNATYTRMRHFYKVPDKYSNSRYGNTTAVVPNLGAWYLFYVDGTNAATNVRIDYTSKYVYTDI